MGDAALDEKKLLFVQFVQFVPFVPFVPSFSSRVLFLIPALRGSICFWWVALRAGALSLMGAMGALALDG